MSNIIKEYLFLIILAAIAVIVLIWYMKKTGAQAVNAVSVPIKKYGEKVSTVGGAISSPVSTITDAAKSLFVDKKRIGENYLKWKADYEAQYKKLFYK